MNDDPDDLSLMFGPDDFGSWPPPPLSPAATSSPESSQADDVDGLEVIGSMEHRGVPKSRLIASPDAVAAGLAAALGGRGAAARGLERGVHGCLRLLPSQGLLPPQLPLHGCVGTI